MFGEAQVDGLVSDRKGSRPGLSLPWGPPLQSWVGRPVNRRWHGALEKPFPWETAGNISLQHVSQAAG